MAFEKEIINMFSASVGDFSVYMNGGNVYIEGVKKVLSVDENKITLVMKKGTIAILGKELKINDCGKGYFSLSGNIERIERT